MKFFEDVNIKATFLRLTVEIGNVGIGCSVSKMFVKVFFFLCCLVCDSDEFLFGVIGGPCLLKWQTLTAFVD